MGSSSWRHAVLWSAKHRHRVHQFWQSLQTRVLPESEWGSEIRRPSGDTGQGAGAGARPFGQSASLEQGQTSLLLQFQGCLSRPLQSLCRFVRFFPLPEDAKSTVDAEYDHFTGKNRCSARQRCQQRALRIHLLHDLVQEGRRRHVASQW